jgi:hypothetical protein
MLHAKDGVVDGGGLWVTVNVEAAEGREIEVNGQAAIYKDGVYRTAVLLKAYENALVAKDMGTGEEILETVYRLLNFAGGYRLSIDDNVWFLRDIHQNEKTYKSIFDNPYLGMLRDLHREYGTKVHLNLFYETEGFNLSELSDKWKDEWAAQRDWIRLSFHALVEFPDMPYKDAGYDQVKKDCELVMGEIRRFAGEAVMGPMTTIHWGEARKEGVRALHACGYRGVLGYFNVDDDKYAVSLYLDEEQRRHMKKRYIWKDMSEDMIFVRTSIVIDKTDLSDIRETLDANRVNGGGLPPYVDLLVHEQYFYPFYFNYQPDFKARLVKAIEWVREHGYHSAFLEESIFGDNKNK